MPTDVISTIAPSGGDYTSMTAWMSARGGDIVSRDTNEIGEFETFSGGLDNTTSFSGSTTDSTHKFILRPATGHEHDGADPTSGFYFNVASTSATIFRPVSTCNHIEMSGIAVIGGGIHFGVTNSGGSNWEILGCILKGSDKDTVSLSHARYIDSTIQNTIILNSGDDGAVFSGTTIGCTIYGSSNRGIVTVAGSVTKNNICMNNTGVDFSDQGGTHDYNISEDGTAVGANSLTNRTIKQSSDVPTGTGDFIIFENTGVGTENFALVDDAENDAIGAGVAVTGWDDDIIGTSRATPPSVGAFEIVPSGVTGSPWNYYAQL